MRTLSSMSYPGRVKSRQKSMRRDPLMVKSATAVARSSSDCAGMSEQSIDQQEPRAAECDTMGILTSVRSVSRAFFASANSATFSSDLARRPSTDWTEKNVMSCGHDQYAHQRSCHQQGRLTRSDSSVKGTSCPRTSLRKTGLNDMSMIRESINALATNWPSTLKILVCTLKGETKRKTTRSDERTDLAHTEG